MKNNEVVKLPPRCQKCKRKCCKTCAKKDEQGKCKVLTEMIGLYEECFAWSNDPVWEARTEEAKRNYLKGWLAWPAKGSRCG